MTRLGQLNTSKPIDQAVREIRTWLDKIRVNGLSIDTRYDAKTNVALLRFSYQGKNYEFRSTKQNNCRLNMWAIARAMESKVRNHIMGIEVFEKSMQAYLLLEGYSEPTSNSDIQVDVRNYALLGMSHLSSNDELQAQYKKLAKTWHPDMAGSEEAKSVFQAKFAEISCAWEMIKKERGMK